MSNNKHNRKCKFCCEIWSAFGIFYAKHSGLALQGLCKQDAVIGISFLDHTKLDTSFAWTLHVFTVTCEPHQSSWIHKKNLHHELRSRRLCCHPQSDCCECVMSTWMSFPSLPICAVIFSRSSCIALQSSPQNGLSETQQPGFFSALCANGKSTQCAGNSKGNCQSMVFSHSKLTALTKNIHENWTTEPDTSPKHTGTET